MVDQMKNIYQRLVGICLWTDVSQLGGPAAVRHLAVTAERAGGHRRPDSGTT